MILYCIISTLVSFGIIVGDKEGIKYFTINDFFVVLAAPLLLPIFIGMLISETINQKKE